MTRRLSIYAPIFVLLCAALQLPAWGLSDGTVSGVVRDAGGSPQIGTLIELVRPDLSVISQTFTDDHGHYTLPRVVPGVYGVKATASLFLPTLRENLHVAPSSKLVVNLTLTTIYEAFRWLPAQPRQVDEPQDDWTWTLRLSANRPLLRMLGDGPLVVMQEADGQSQALKARVTVRGGESGFGDGGVHNDFEVRRTNDDRKQLLVRADLSQAGDPALNTVVGYEQQVSPNSTIKTVAAFVDRPEIAGGPDSQGFEAMVFRSAEALDLTPMIHLEGGSEFEAVHLGETLLASHPFGAVKVQAGDTALTYRVTTTPGLEGSGELDRESTLVPAVGEADGRLLLEHGLHQELALSHTDGNVRWTMAVYHDRDEHPMIEGGGSVNAADWKAGDLLYDASTDTLRVAGAGYSTNGVLAELHDVLPQDMWLTVAAAMGNAMTMDAATTQPETLQQNLASIHPERAEMLSASFGGKLANSKTQLQASYRWQTKGSLTPVDTYNRSLADPYLSFYVRQPFHYRCILPNGMEAMIDVRNLLAQGYRPVLTSDGSLLYFAQASRAIEAGLAFNF
ncbi:carboxypeptidase-like regulatory domain-containing protein [Silvibacterium sp.]|uniref:carboxypeptidase-like regulatory domain-containing protein n=1 Tax=Silvibacterium sp. TaxID=1964179 RepID=UPI0039E6FDDC